MFLTIQFSCTRKIVSCLFDDLAVKTQGVPGDNLNQWIRSIKNLNPRDYFVIISRQTQTRRRDGEASQLSVPANPTADVQLCKGVTVLRRGVSVGWCFERLRRSIFQIFRLSAFLFDSFEF